MLSNLEILARLLLAAGLGSLIGIERERLHWAAGLRTHMLVSVGACLIMIVSAFGFADALGRPDVVLDPSRVAAQVVSGIGFLGAGTILLHGEIIRGLTTAASLWGVAAVGLAVGGGLYVPALAATLVVLVILAGIKPLENRLRSRLADRTLKLTADREAMTFEHVGKAVGMGSDRIRQFVLLQKPDHDEITITIAGLSDTALSDLASNLRKSTHVRSVSIVA